MFSPVLGCWYIVSLAKQRWSLSIMHRRGCSAFQNLCFGEWVAILPLMYNLSNLYSSAHYKLTSLPRSLSTHDKCAMCKMGGSQVDENNISASSAKHVHIYFMHLPSTIGYLSLLCRILCRNYGRISWTDISFAIISSIWPPWHVLDTEYKRSWVHACSS